MAKLSALDRKVAEIDERLGALEDETKRLREMRDFMTHGTIPTVTPLLPKVTTKPNRTRGPNKPKPGLDGSQRAIASRAATEPAQ
jgi:hypothetical protein